MRNTMLVMLAGAILMGIGLASQPVSAQEAPPPVAHETKLGAKGFKSPPATIEQMSWLVGQWIGTGIQDAPAIEECAAYFHALTLRCDDRKDGTRGLLAAVRMQSGGELVFRFESRTER